MTAGPRVLVGGLFHETNTFLRRTTPLAEFDVTDGDGMWARVDDGSPLAAALAVARARSWQVSAAADVRAMPSGTASDEVLETFWEKVLLALEKWSGAAADGVLLVLHGAMVTDTVADVEGELLYRLRRNPRTAGARICCVLDLHANVSPAMAAGADALVAYRENPHADAFAAGQRAAELLDTMLRSPEPVTTVLTQAPLILPPTRTATADAPMSQLLAMARQIEAAEPDIYVVNVTAGFSFADVEDTGLAFSAVTRGNPAAAAALLEPLRRAALRLADATVPELTDLSRAFSDPFPRSGPRLVVEPADNIGGGAPGDLTPVLAGLLASGMANAGVILNDPAAVSAVAGLATGSILTLPVGGASQELGARPLHIEAELVSVRDGRFTLADENSHLASMGGRFVDMGRCAVLRCRNNLLLLTSRKTPPFDLAQWRSQGIDPGGFRLIGVKAAVGHRRAYEAIEGDSMTVDTLGPCAERVERLPYGRVRRPIFPLDPLPDAPPSGHGGPGPATRRGEADT